LLNIFFRFSKNKMSQAERLLAVSLKEFNLVPSRPTQRQAATILLKMVTNIAKNQPQYRKICVDNPVLQNQLLSVRGARTALRGIGFVIDESGEFYEYNNSDLGRSSAFLQAFLDDLDRRDAEGETDGATGKNFVRRQGPSTNEGFKRFKDGMEGLKQRWAELEFVVRVPITTKETYLEARQGVAAAQAFLILLESVAKEVDLLQGVIMQSISGDGAGHGGTGSAVEGKVDESKVTELREGMFAIRSLMRLKITDDADLDTARRSVLDVGEFFTLLSKEALDQNKSEFDVLQSL
jgi:hypothetical protein